MTEPQKEEPNKDELLISILENVIQIYESLERAVVGMSILLKPNKEDKDESNPEN